MSVEHAAYTASIERLIRQLGRLPGIGRRSAERLAFYLLKASTEEALELSAAIAEVKRTVHQCSICANLSESDPCPLCTDPRRDRSVVLVVEEPKDVLSFETTGLFKGLYHVLMGRLAPLDGVGPGELTVQSLMDRVTQSQSEGTPIREIILGTSANLEGDGTAMYLAQQLGTLGVKVTRLARGLPVGYGVEQASKAVLSEALQARHAF